MPEPIVTHGQWRIACDPAATREVCSRIDPGPLVCGCAFCRNFTLVGERHLPAEFVELVRNLGLRPVWAREVYDLGPAPDGGRLTGGWYHFVGRVLDAPKHKRPQSVDPVDCIPYHVDFSTHPAAPAEEFGALSVLQMDFVVTVPWMLDEPPPTDAEAAGHRSIETTVANEPRPSARPRPDLAGRFVVEFKNQRATGLPADEIIDSIDDPNWNPLAIYRIQNVHPDGRMELVGVDDADFAARTAILLRGADVKPAREIYERILSAGRQSPPPCRIDLQLSKGPDGPTRYAIALLFPAVCQDAVGNWLRKAGIADAMIEAAGLEALADYEARSPDVVINDVVPSSTPQ